MHRSRLIAQLREVCSAADLKRCSFRSSGAEAFCGPRAPLPPTEDDVDLFIKQRTAAYLRRQIIEPLDDLIRNLEEL